MNNRKKSQLKIQPRRTARFYKLKFMRLKGDPHFLARGVAVGTFIGITPTIPLHTILILLFAIILRGSKLAGLIASVIVSNPLTFFLQYFLAWKIGNWITPRDLSWGRIQSLMDFIHSGSGFLEILHAIGELGLETIFALVTGGCILALPFTVIAYVLTCKYFLTMQRKRQAKLNLSSKSNNNVQPT